jgi:hypothetical protein
MNNETPGDEGGERLTTTAQSMPLLEPCLMTITAKSPFGCVTTMTARPDHLIEDLKKHLKEIAFGKNVPATGIPLRYQEIVFRGRRHPNDKTLADCGIHHGSIVFWVLNGPRGGGFRGPQY